MNKITVTLPTSDLGDLNKPPHVLSYFFYMIIDKRQPIPEQQEQRWEHLVKCIYCQAVLGSYLLKVVEQHKIHGEAGDFAEELLKKLTHIMHETLKEDIPAYVEALEEKGENEANNQFFLLREHLHVCRDCQLTVQDLRSWLEHLEEGTIL